MPSSCSPGPEHPAAPGTRAWTRWVALGAAADDDRHVSDRFQEVGREVERSGVLEYFAAEERMSEVAGLGTLKPWDPTPVPGRFPSPIAWATSCTISQSA